MAKSPDHPELNFVQAAGYTKGRPDGPPLWIVIHDMEAGESSTRAESTAAYFASGADGRQVSSHYCADNNSVIQCVLLKDVAWTVGNRPGNNRGINWELAGYARQTRAEWLDEFGLAMFHQMAPIVRADAAKYGIPLARCSVADLKAGRRGVTSHNDLRLAFGVTTHTDPGANFPWDVFLEIVKEEDVTPEQDKMLRAINARVGAFAAGTPTVVTSWSTVKPDGVEPQWEVAQLTQLRTDVDELQARPAAPPAVVDQAMLKAALLDPEFLAAVAVAVADENARRQAA